MGTLWAQLLLQFSFSCFETLQMFSEWNEDIGSGVIWFGYNTLIIFSHFFCFVNLKSRFFLHEMLSKCIDSGYLVGTTPLTVFF